MSEIKDGGPAFPMHDGHNMPVKTVAEFERAMQGMSLRDYFAASAVQGWLASFDPAGEPAEYADAMLATHS